MPLPRLIYANLLHLPDAVLIPSSEELAMPRAALLRVGVTDILRWRGGWDVRSGENDRIDFNRGGAKVATITAGHYDTPAAYAAAVVAALEAADATPVWACSRSSSTYKFTISSDLSFTLLFGAGANLARSAHVDLGYTSTNKAAATSHLAENSAHQSRRSICLDTGAVEAPGTWVVVEGVNDMLDIEMQTEGVLALTVPPGSYNASALAAAIRAAWVEAGAPDVPSMYVDYDAGTLRFSFSTIFGNAHRLLTGTGANLAESLWTAIGFNVGADSTLFTYHESDVPTKGSPAPDALAALVRGFSFSDSAVVRVDADSATLVGQGLGASVDFTQALTKANARGAYLSTVQSARYWRLIIEDVQNDDTFIDLGIWFLGDYVELPGIKPGIVDGRDDLSSIEYAMEGAHTVIRRPARRIYDLTVHNITEAKKVELEAFADATPIGAGFFLDLAGDAIASARYVFLERGLEFQSVEDTYPVLWTCRMRFCEVLG
jgi:hypothetical protein